MDALQPEDAGPAVRADVRRNRERILAAARPLFESAEERLPLETVAQAAGVGIGTLYRHFPTREALIEAVYQSELDEVICSAPELLSGSPADAALRTWLDRYARFMVTKRGLHRSGAPAVLATPGTRERLTATVRCILQAGAEDGSLRTDVDPDDVVTNLLGIFLATASDTDGDRAGRLLDLIIHALRPRDGGAGF